MGSGDEDPRCEDGGGAHEVRLARALPQEQRGQPGEAAVLGLRGPGAVLVSPHDAAPPGALLRPGIGVNNNITTSVRSQGRYGDRGTGVNTPPSLLQSLKGQNKFFCVEI